MADEIKEEVQVTSAKSAATKRAAKQRLRTEVVGVDTPHEDVVKWISEGRKLVFEDRESFLELDTELVRSLTRENRERYDMAKTITFGADPIGAIEDGRRGWEQDYNIMPGSASSRTVVTGKDPSKEYFLARKDAVGYHQSKGKVVTRDPNVKVGGKDESCSYKTVGGQASPEMVLMEIDKKVAQKQRAERSAIRDRIIQGTNESYKETAARNGFATSVDYTETSEIVGG
jgi:hypothetical protein